MKSLLLGILCLCCLSCTTFKRAWTVGPTNPSQGTLYVGTATLFSTVSFARTCPATIYVQQQDRAIRLDNLVLNGACDGYEFPVGIATLSQDNETFQTGGVLSDPFCGTVTYRAEGFLQGEGRFLRLEYRYGENMCGATSIQLDMTRAVNPQ